jgi:hypothetical protein
MPEVPAGVIKGTPTQSAGRLSNRPEQAILPKRWDWAVTSDREQGRNGTDDTGELTWPG